MIPFPSNYVDVLFTLSGRDHVDNCEVMCPEVQRVLRSGGEFIGSFNLNGPATPCEPQTLTEGLVRTHLLDHLEVTSCRKARRNDGPGDLYDNLYTDNLNFVEGEMGFLWVRGRKRS